jgi:hypothetical protein
MFWFNVPILKFKSDQIMNLLMLKKVIFCSLLSLSTVACNNNSDSGSAEDDDDLVNIGDGAGGTAGGDGSGGGEIISNDTGEQVIVDVDYKQRIDEDKLGIPKDPSAAIRKTIIEIALNFKPSELNTALSASGASKPSDFNPQDTASFQIKTEGLVVQDSAGNEHELVLYLVLDANNTVNTKAKFYVFATLNNIAYNTQSYNQSHTAMYVRGAKIGANPNDYEVISDSIWNQGKLQTEDTNILPTEWVGGYFTSENSKSTIDHSPSTTKYPCYQEYDGYDCNEYDSNTGLSNIVKEGLVFQPIATVGYQDFDWFGHVFTDSEFTAHTPTATPNPELHAAAVAETKSILANNQSATGKEIGWFGLPIEQRNKMIRYHAVAVKFSLNEADTGNKIHIGANDIKIAHYTEGTNDSKTPVSINNPELILDYKDKQATED